MSTLRATQQLIEVLHGVAAPTATARVTQQLIEVLYSAEPIEPDSATKVTSNVIQVAFYKPAELSNSLYATQQVIEVLHGVEAPSPAARVTQFALEVLYSATENGIKVTSNIVQVAKDAPTTPGVLVTHDITQVPLNRDIIAYFNQSVAHVIYQKITEAERILSTHDIIQVAVQHPPEQIHTTSTVVQVAQNPPYQLSNDLYVTQQVIEVLHGVEAPSPAARVTQFALEVLYSVEINAAKVTHDIIQTAFKTDIITAVSTTDTIQVAFKRDVHVVVDQSIVEVIYRKHRNSCLTTHNIIQTATLKDKTFARSSTNITQVAFKRDVHVVLDQSIIEVIYRKHIDTAHVTDNIVQIATLKDKTFGHVSQNVLQVAKPGRNFIKEFNVPVDNIKDVIVGDCQEGDYLTPLSGPNSRTRLDQDIHRIHSDSVAEQYRNDSFGYALDGDGEYFVIGARYGESGTTYQNCGQAYLFKSTARDPFPVFCDIRYPENLGGGDYYGDSVAMDGKTVVVGARGDDDQGTQAGAAYVYSITDNELRYVQKISVTGDHNDNGDATHDAWWTISDGLDVYNDWIVFGSYPLDYDVQGNFKENVGSVTTFFYNGTMWEQGERLEPTGDHIIADSYFGNSVNINGDYLFVGANLWNDQTQTVNDGGAVFVYKRDESNHCSQIQIVTPEGINAWRNSDHFGRFVRAYDDLLAVGSVYQDYDENGENVLTSAGAVYIFQRSGDTYTQIQKICQPSRAAYRYFGTELNLGIINGRLGLIVTTRYQDTKRGASYLYYWNGSNFDYAQELKPSLGSNSRQEDDLFGRAIGIGSHAVVIGSEQHEYDNQGLNHVSRDSLNRAKGAAFVWSNSQQKCLKAPIETNVDPSDVVTHNTVQIAIKSNINQVRSSENVVQVAVRKEKTFSRVTDDTVQVAFKRDVHVVLDQSIVEVVYRKHRDTSFITEKVTQVAVKSEFNRIHKTHNVIQVARDARPIISTFTTQIENKKQVDVGVCTDEIVQLSGPESHTRLDAGIWRNCPPLDTLCEVFGYSVVADGEYIVVGSPFASTDVPGYRGSIHLFKSTAGDPFPTELDVEFGIINGDQLGRNLSIDGKNVLACAIGHDYFTLTRDFPGGEFISSAGAGILYTIENDQFVGPHTIFSPTGAPGIEQTGYRKASDYWGYLDATRIKNGWVALGSYNRDFDQYGNVSTNNGGVVVWKQTGDITQWHQTQYITPTGDHNMATQNFGISLDFAGSESELLIVGANGWDDVNGEGAAFVFKRGEDDQYVQVQHLYPTGTNAWRAGDNFGRWLRAYGSLLVVYSYGQDYDENGENHLSGSRGGAVYIFKRDGDTYTQVQKVCEPSRDTAVWGDGFDLGIINGQTGLLIGSKEYSWVAEGDKDRYGSQYVFLWDGVNFQFHKKLERHLGPEESAYEVGEELPGRNRAIADHCLLIGAEGHGYDAQGLNFCPHDGGGGTTEWYKTGAVFVWSNTPCERLTIPIDIVVRNADVVTHSIVQVAHRSGRTEARTSEDVVQIALRREKTVGHVTENVIQIGYRRLVNRIHSTENTVQIATKSNLNTVQKTVDLIQIALNRNVHVLLDQSIVEVVYRKHRNSSITTENVIQIALQPQIPRAVSTTDIVQTSLQRFITAYFDQSFAQVVYRKAVDTSFTTENIIQIGIRPEIEYTLATRNIVQVASRTEVPRVISTNQIAQIALFPIYQYLIKTRNVAQIAVKTLVDKALSSHNIIQVAIRRALHIKTTFNVIQIAQSKFVDQAHITQHIIQLARFLPDTVVADILSTQVAISRRRDQTHVTRYRILLAFKRAKTFARQTYYAVQCALFPDKLRAVDTTNVVQVAYRGSDLTVRSSQNIIQVAYRAKDNAAQKTQDVVQVAFRHQDIAAKVSRYVIQAVLSKRGFEADLVTHNVVQVAFRQHAPADEAQASSNIIQVAIGVATQIDADYDVPTKVWRFIDSSVSLIKIISAQLDYGAGYTDQTSAALDDTVTSDVTPLDATPAVNDYYYCGARETFSRITFNISTDGVWVGTLDWQYYNGSSWTSLSEVVDYTNAFTNAGDVHFAVPSNWALATVNSIEAYYVRARVASFTSITTQPLADSVNLHVRAEVAAMPAFVDGNPGKFLYMDCGPCYYNEWYNALNPSWAECCRGICCCGCPGEFDAVGKLVDEPGNQSIRNYMYFTVHGTCDMQEAYKCDRYYLDQTEPQPDVWDCERKIGIGGPPVKEQRDDIWHEYQAKAETYARQMTLCRSDAPGMAYKSTFSNAETKDCYEKNEIPFFENPEEWYSDPATRHWRYNPNRDNPSGCWTYPGIAIVNDEIVMDENQPMPTDVSTDYCCDGWQITLCCDQKNHPFFDNPKEDGQLDCMDYTAEVCVTICSGDHTVVTEQDNWKWEDWNYDNEPEHHCQMDRYWAENCITNNQDYDACISRGCQATQQIGAGWQIEGGAEGQAVVLGGDDVIACCCDPFWVTFRLKFEKYDCCHCDEGVGRENQQPEFVLEFLSSNTKKLAQWTLTSNVIAATEDKCENDYMHWREDLA
jgi:hypothetical protein